MADEIPPPLYSKLNGGILLLPESKRSPRSGRGDLLVLGEYHHEPNGLGRYIVLYYGSLRQAVGQLPAEQFVAKLREVLRHELTHHIESLSGQRELEKQDEAQLARYRRDGVWE